MSSIVDAEARYYHQSPVIIDNYITKQLAQKEYVLEKFIPSPPSPAFLATQKRNQFFQTLEKNIQVYNADTLHLSLDDIHLFDFGTQGKIYYCTALNYKTNKLHHLAIKVFTEKGHFLEEINVLQVLRMRGVRHVFDYIHYIEDFKIKEVPISYGLVLPCKRASLHAIIHKHFNYLTLIKIKKYLIQLLETLEDLRKLQIVHADIKPSNILIDEDEVTLADWVTVVNTSVPMSTSLPRCTLEYRAPECYLHERMSESHQTSSKVTEGPSQVSLEKYSSKIDMWSLGCVFFEMVVGKRLFDRKDDIMLKIAEELGPPPNYILNNALNGAKFQSLKLVSAKGINRSCFEQALLTKKTDPQEVTLAVDLLFDMLNWAPCFRSTPTVALSHPFLRSSSPPSSSSSSSSSSTSKK